MKDIYEIITPEEPQKRACLSCIGKFFSSLYLITQIIFILLIGVALTHESISLFRNYEWQLMIGLLIFNLVLAITLKCAYNFNYVHWEEFRFTFLILSLTQIIGHVGVPALYFVLKSFAIDDYDKAFYDSRMLFFGALAIIDGLFFILTGIPYYFLYEVKKDKAA